MNIRKIALDLLSEYEAGNKYVNLLLSSRSLDALTGEERASLTALLYTAVERKLTYDYYITALAKRAPEKIDSHTRNILRLGLCQIADMRSVPSFAAVNETVKLARNQGERAFVNGILRAAARDTEALPLPDREKNFKRYLSVKYSFPLHLVKHFVSLIGEEETEKLLDYYNTAKYTDLTVNTQKTTTEDYIKWLSERKIEATSHPSVPNSIRIERSVNPESLPHFADGHFFVQDRASLLASLVLAPAASERVIDVCACPGGKSFAAAILSGDGSEIYSFDLHESKLSLIEGGAERLGLKSVRASQRDALTPDESLFGTADKVICDAPCSGLGVLSKKPDLRYKAPEALRELPELQLSILKESSKYLKRGGTLVYSTCTLNPAENEEVVLAFLRENPEFFAEDFTVGEYSSLSGMLTLYPHRTHTDGFFIAKLRRAQL